MSRILERLVPSDDPAERDTFHRQIDDRKNFALRMVKGPLASEAAVNAGEEDPKVGVTRWQCPAVAGAVGCPLRAGTMEVARELGLPTVPEAPTEEDAPRCCTQSTIQIEADDAMKYFQEKYWGGKEWTQLYALRSAVEGVFGNLKNYGTEGVRRGFYQTDGIHMFTLAVTAAAACYNIRTLEKFFREQGQRLAHPLMNHPLDGAILENVLLEGDEVREYIERHQLAAA
ncbi:hypothetical protein [Nocardioides sp. P86]|uniref:hypothetical protein n=1 Tax=Nocardioides sp. P86 TaxID=2939569 RepID=UPI00203D4C38|nr:hypothetical protein [Nocardioides sp. P86]MCM3516248.1 hypothetical protein [Nocardioides sp. P86]